MDLADSPAPAVVAPGLVVHLLGRPRIELPSGDSYRFRSRKSWALLTYLVLADGPPNRTQAAELLFGEADDPLRALRWSLTEIRRCLGEGSVDGDPLVLRLPHGSVVDAMVVVHEPWAAAVEVAGLGSELLAGASLRGAPAFESWLLSERRRLSAATEAILHEAALGLMARGQLDRARDFAVRAATTSPLDENHQALLIRLYRQAGDDIAAERQYAAFARLLEEELGVVPGAAVEAALRERARSREAVATEASVEAIIEAGSAATAAGAVEPGVASLRTAVELADAGRAPGPQIHARIVLAEALIHALRGFDEEGIANLHEADRLAADSGDTASSARARGELGYVDFLRARYDRAEVWLKDAIELAAQTPRYPEILAKATTYLGSVESDRANYPRAAALLEEAEKLAQEAGDPRREAYALSMSGRVHLLRGDLDEAGEQLGRAVELAERDHWLSFLPWPQALQGELHVARHDPSRATETLEQAFARACQLGDPCWEGLAARGLALVAESRGETDDAFGYLCDARARANRLADPYVWLDVHILDALCELGRRHRHPRTRHWVATMAALASRAGMRELTVRAMVHQAALGGEGDAHVAALLAAEIDNPVLQALV